MRSSSKKKLERQNSKYVESRILISTGNLNPLSNHIASKLDLIKQEISRQFHEKFPTQKKRNHSVKKTTSSSKFKTQTVKNVARKLDFAPQSQRISHQQNQEYRQKYNEINEKYFIERQKGLDQYEKNALLKEKIISFLEEPSKNIGDQLCQILDSQRTKKNIQKLISLNQDVVFAENTLNQIMSLMQVEDIETLLAQLQNYPGKYRNLDECTYKIVQLETNFNKTIEEYQLKLGETIEIGEKKHQEEMKKHQEQISQIREQIIKEKDLQLNQLKHDLCQIIKEWGSLGMAESQYESSHQPKQLLRKLETILIQMDRNLEIIANEAKENMESFINTKEDLNKIQGILQKLMEEASEEKNKFQHEYQSLFRQCESIKGQLKNQIQKMNSERKHFQNVNHTNEQEINRLTEEKMKQQFEFKKKQGQFWNIVQDLNRICFDSSEQAQYSGNSLQKIKKLASLISEQMDDLKNKLEQAESFAHWQEKQLGVKQGLLSQFDFNLKKMLEDNKALKDEQARLQLERDEFKYLLTNVRQQLMQTKKEYEEKLKQVVCEKDEEYLNSNRDILEVNEKLQNERKILKLQINQIEEELKNEKASHYFYKKKTQQTEKNLSDMKKKIITSQNQANKYKKYLTDIELSLKEVESISQMNSTKANNLQQEKKTIIKELQGIKLKNYNLSTQLQQEENKYKQASALADDYMKKVKQLQTLQQELEYNNSELRIANLQRNQKMRSLEDEVRQLKVQNGHLLKENHKFSKQLNQMTKKLLTKVDTTTKKYQLVKSKKQAKRKFQLLRIEINKLKQTFLGMVAIQKQQFTSQLQLMLELQAFSPQEKEKVQQIEEIKPITYEKQKVLKLSYQLKEDVQNMKGFVENIRKQIVYQTNTVGKMMKNIQPYLQQGEQKIASIIQSLFKTKLMLCSLTNESKSIKEDLEDTQTMISEFSQLEFTIVPQKVQFDQVKQQLSKEQISQESPQFMRIKRSQSSFGKNENPFDEAIIMSEGQGEPFLPQEINNILQSLKDDTEINVPYFEKIKQNYVEIKKKLHHKNLNLDISAVSFKPQTFVSSPTSINLSKDFILEKRLNTDPEEITVKESNRSQQQTTANQIRNQNIALRNQIRNLEEKIDELEDHGEEMKISITQLQKKNTVLENQTSLKTIEKLFGRFLDGMFNQKLQVMENNCTILMKILCCSPNEIEAVKDNFSKRKKKKNNFFSGIFAKN